MILTTCYPHFYFFFFFQAEDGIRDYKVTGVQTCALPISPRARSCPRGTGTWSCSSGTGRASRDSRPRPSRRPGRTAACARPSPKPSSPAGGSAVPCGLRRSEEHTSELQSPCNLVCRLLLEKKKKHTVWKRLR